ncbi:hypothetical protein CSC03_4784 [Enterobacter hormaechei]|nr:hypothetical protein CSC03_4784 [Enterobacter hormaechei]HAT2454663.1 hypothetical protein [Citrobacter freundii]HAT2814895.1 hypothetical protein [Citrobacter freundii]
MSSSANRGAILLTRRARFRRRVAAFRSSLQRLIGRSYRKSTQTAYPAPATHSDITDSGAGFPASTTSDASSGSPGQGPGRFQRSE